MNGASKENTRVGVGYCNTQLRQKMAGQKVQVAILLVAFGSHLFC